MALEVNGKKITATQIKNEEQVRNYLDLNAKNVEDMAAELVMEALSRDAVKEDIKALVLSAIPVDTEESPLELYWDGPTRSIITFVPLSDGDGTKTVVVKDFRVKPPWYKRIFKRE